jgi:ribonuclease T1
VDPLVSTTGQPFAYVGDDPVNGSDPSGLEDDGGGSDGGTEGGFQVNFDGPNDGDETQVLSSEVANEHKLMAEGKNACNACGSETEGEIEGTQSCSAAANLETAPENVQSVFADIEENGRTEAPPGYQGGDPFENREGLLPSEDSEGSPVTYQEWDVNPFTKGVNRGEERIVTGTDGSAYYTLNHYKTFTQIR